MANIHGSDHATIDQSDSEKQKLSYLFVVNINLTEANGPDDLSCFTD